MTLVCCDTFTYQVLYVAIDVLLHAGRAGGHPAPQRAELHGVGLMACAVATLVELGKRKQTYGYFNTNTLTCLEGGISIRNVLMGVRTSANGTWIAHSIGYYLDLRERP